MKNIFLLIIVFSIFLSKNTFCAEQGNSDADENLTNFIHEIFDKSKIITVKSIPIGMELFGEEALTFDIKNEWVTSITFRCPAAYCNNYGGALKAFFSSGLRISNNCWAFENLIALEGDSTLHEIFIDSSGHCFKIEGNSYYTEESFYDVAPHSELNPSFIRK
ncbi:MAG: hypothetical protein Q7V56_13930 [Gammaproteobacteria bacterium]|nr:hypothetical protein [Gammaproteobacteria bacterium]